MAFSIFLSRNSCRFLGYGIWVAVQLPGVGGGAQVAAIYALTKLFSVGAEAATSAGILTWIIIALPCLALGVILLVHEGLTFKKLEAIAEEERAAAEEEV